MSILQSTQEPSGGAKVVMQALLQLHNPAADPADLRSSNPGTIRYGWHHAVYDLDAKALAAGGGLEQARRTASRYLLADASGLRGAIEIATDQQGANAGEFLSLNQGPFVQGTKAAIDLAQVDVDNGICTFSLLRIAALKVALLRVKPDDSSRATRYYAIAPSALSLPGGPRHSGDDLLAVLRPMAQALFESPRASTGSGDLSD